MIHKLLHLLPKPLLFALLGALGCVLGWAAGEPLLKTVKPKPQAEGTGASKRAAEQAAALAMLTSVGVKPDIIDAR